MDRKGYLYGVMEEGIERVLTENYAALNDEILLKYHTTKDCDLMLIGTPITQVGALDVENSICRPLCRFSCLSVPVCLPF